MIGLLMVCAFIFAFQDTLLKIPLEASTFGRLTLAIGLVPAVIVAVVGASWTRLHRWSAPVYVGAVAVILTAQMFERAVQTPKGFDVVVPFLMPISVLLALSVVQIPYNLLMPATGALLAGVILCETLTIAHSGHQVLAMSTATVMVFVAVRFAYQLERSRRVGWSRSKTLELLSRTDPLTQLPNRRAFLNHLRGELAARRATALLLIDIDHFKEYNDNFGHLAGDECLSAVAAQIQSAAQGYGGFAARLGGEEFAVTLPSGSGIHDRAERLRAAAIGPSKGHHPPCGRVTASAGLAQCAEDSGPIELDIALTQLISRADEALYRAKRSGRNRLSLWSGRMWDGIRTR